MRSHPYTPPPPLPPLLADLAETIDIHVAPLLISHHQRASYHSRSSDIDIPLLDLDPDTSQLLRPLPAAARHQHHRVRVQGHLALVRSVSAANLRHSYVEGHERLEAAVGGAVGRRKLKTKRARRRRLSLDGGPGADDTKGETDEEEVEEWRDSERERETIVRDGQLRSYGIGGWGNIRRPTDVAQFPPSRGGLDHPRFLSNSTLWKMRAEHDSRRWNFRDLIGLVADRKGKGKSAI